MRIALVVEKFLRSGGGVEYAVWEIAQALLASGDEVHVIAREAEALDGVRLHRVRVSSLWQPWRVWQFSRAAQKVIHAEAFDLVHGFALTETQDVFHAGGGSHEAYLRHGYGSLGAALRRWTPRHRIRLHLERKVARANDTLIQCVSELGAREFQDLYGVGRERIAVVPCGVDSQRFSPSQADSERRGLREAWGGDAGNVWLFPGSGFQRKGLETALAALGACEDPSARLWVVGKDEPSRWKKRARAWGVADRVHFLGRRGDMEKIYNAADGIILPSRYDGWGLVCLEAASCSRPVIMSAQCGASEILSGVACVIDCADDVKAFAAALDHFRDAETRDQAGRAGRGIAEEYGWDRCASSLRDLYGSIPRSRRLSSGSDESR